MVNISNNGISLISLAIIIVVMITLSSVIFINAYGSIEESNKTKFAVEIVMIQEAVNRYIDNNGNHPVKEVVTVNLQNLSNEAIEQFQKEEAVNNLIYLSVIDMELIGIENINFGNKVKENDVYVISTISNKVYYLEGIRYKNEIYYTYTQDMLKNVEIPQNLSYNEINKQGVIFIPNITKYTNEVVKLKIKVPIEYENVEITTTNEKSVSSGTLVNEYNEYDVNKGSGNKEGNYKTDVSFNLNGKLYNVYYIVDNYDGIVPSIEIPKQVNVVNEDGTITKHLTEIYVTDGKSGVKEIKYELQDIMDKEYFLNYGKVLKGSSIQLANDEKFTIYAVDKAGNESMLRSSDEVFNPL